MQPDFFAVPIAAPPAGLVSAGREPGPAGQVFEVWRSADQRQYLSVLVGGREKWFYMAATSGREMPGWN